MKVYCMMDLMKAKINIPGWGSIDVEEDNPENIKQLFKSLPGLHIAKDMVENKLKTSVCTSNPTEYSSKDIELAYVAVDKKIAEKWYKGIHDRIKSKPDFEHDVPELMDNVLGKRIKQKEEPRAYETFLNKVRLARKHIAREENIEWDSTRITYGSGSNPLVFRIKRSDNQFNPNAQQNEE